MCNIEQVFVEAIEEIAKAETAQFPDTVIRVIDVSAPDCLVEWQIPSFGMVMRGWAHAEDNPKSTKDIRWYSLENMKAQNGQWPDFLKTTIERAHAEAD